MVGEVGRNGNGLVYYEWLYDRGQGGRLDMHMTSQCRFIESVPVVADPAWTTRRPRPAPDGGSSTAQQQAPSQQSGPVQQNGPIAITPTPNITINNYPASKVKAQDDGS
jgi:hypothetical protein